MKCKRKKIKGKVDICCWEKKKMSLATKLKFAIGFCVFITKLIERKNKACACNRRKKWFKTSCYSAIHIFAFIKFSFPEKIFYHSRPILYSHSCLTHVWDKISWRHRLKHCTNVFLRKNSKIWLTYMAKWVCFGPLFFNFAGCSYVMEKNLTSVDCCDKILLNSPKKT